MATKSFLTDFKMSAKSGHKIVQAFDNSKSSKHVIGQKIIHTKDKNSINNLMDAFLGSSN